MAASRKLLLFWKDNLWFHELQIYAGRNSVVFPGEKETWPEEDDEEERDEEEGEELRGEVETWERVLERKSWF